MVTFPFINVSVWSGENEEGKASEEGRSRKRQQVPLWKKRAKYLGEKQKNAGGHCPSCEENVRAYLSEMSIQIS